MKLIDSLQTLANFMRHTTMRWSLVVVVVLWLAYCDMTIGPMIINGVRTVHPSRAQFLPWVIFGVVGFLVLFLIGLYFMLQNGFSLWGTAKLFVLALLVTIHFPLALASPSKPYTFAVGILIVSLFIARKVLIAVFPTPCIQSRVPSQ